MGAATTWPGGTGPGAALMWGVVLLAAGCTAPNPAYTGDRDSGPPADSRAQGTLGGPCYPNQTCNAGLQCRGGTCVRRADSRVWNDSSPNIDQDGDGFTPAAGDCLDSDPAVNPAAMEVAGIPCDMAADCPSGSCVAGYCRCANGADCHSADPCTADADCRFDGETCQGGTCRTDLSCLAPQAGMPGVPHVCRDNRDDDCDGTVDELSPLCDDPTQLNKHAPRHYALALDLCPGERTCGGGAVCPGKSTCVGGRCQRVVGVTIDNSSSPKARAILERFARKGPVKPPGGQAFVALSTGLADYDPDDDCPQPGTSFSKESTDPDPGVADTKALDMVRFTFKLAAPSNARSLQLRLRLFSAEYPESLGTKFNDALWVELGSTAFNGNITTDSKGAPLRVSNTPFSICDPEPSKPATKQMCTTPASTLDGTGFYTECGQTRGKPKQATGASTGWLRTTAPVTPGEVLTLSVAIYDKGDDTHDTTVLLDGFRWGRHPLTTPVTAGID